MSTMRLSRGVEALRALVVPTVSAVGRVVVLLVLPALVRPPLVLNKATLPRSDLLTDSLLLDVIASGELAIELSVGVIVGVGHILILVQIIHLFSVAAILSGGVLATLGLQALVVVLDIV
jgi:hypothetical protein